MDSPTSPTRNSAVHTAFRSGIRRTLPVLAIACLCLPAQAEDLQALVNRANAAAEQEDLATAIPLYEQAVRQAPGEAILKKNLAVLYVNHGIVLQDQKKYAESMVLFDKALELFPDSKPARDAKSGSYFYQAQDLKAQGSGDYAAMRALLEKAIALNPNEPAFKQALASAYLDEAYQLATQEQFAEAAPLLEKALEADPAHQAARQSLANVYLGLAKNHPEQREAWADKAVAVDNSPRIQQLRAQILKLDAGGSEPGGLSGMLANGFTRPSEARAAAPADITELSVNEMVAVMEKQLVLKSRPDATLVERLAVLEEHIHGKAKEGPLAVRAKDAYTALMGSYGGALSASNVNLVQAPVEASDSSYLDAIFKVTDGKVIRWGKFPLRVYVEEPKDNPLYKPEYKEAVLHGLNAWKVKTQDFVNYVEIQDPAVADVVVKFEADYVDRYADPETVPDFYKNYTPPKQSHLMKVLQVASMFAPGYYSLAPQAIGAAMQYQQYKKLDVIRDESKITLGLNPTRDLSDEQAKIAIQNMAAKEFGHVLGLKAASPHPGDLLYPELKTDSVQLPTRRDLETLRQLYNRPPNIILNVQ